MGDNNAFAGESTSDFLKLKSVEEDGNQNESFSRIEEFVGLSSPFNQFTPDFFRNNQNFDWSEFSCDLKRQSLVYLPDELPRESLGLLNMNNLDLFQESAEQTKTQNQLVPFFNFASDSIATNNLPEVLITKISDNSNCSLLNCAFTKLPLTSDGSSVSSFCPSFNSGSLESTMPSRISSTSSNISVINDAFCGTSEYLKRIKSSISSVSPTKSTSFVDDVFCVSQKEELKEDNKDSDLQELVLIEARHFAEKLADGTFTEKDDDLLDTTEEPEDFANVLEVEEPIKYDTETVFKTIDKLFVPNNHSEFVNKTEDEISKHSNSSVKSETNSSRSKSSSRSREALDIIHSLSEILNPERKEEGQNLLSSLAEIVISSSTPSRSCNLEDSGHSSIEEEAPSIDEKGETFEVLDLRKKSSSASNLHNPENAICEPLDLSFKSKSFVSPKVLPPKYSRVTGRAAISLNSNNSLISNCSVSSNESRNSSLGRFKPKKPDEKLTVLKKGPMKALHPVGNMAKTNVPVNPKTTPKRSSINKMKKTSTPINDSNLKPMAQSTPENKMILSPSPVTKDSNILKEKSNDSDANSRLNKKNVSKSVVNSFRKSSGEMKQKSVPQKQLVRSHSMESKSDKLAKPPTRRGSFSYSKTDKAAPPIESRYKFVGRQSLQKKPGKENLKMS